MGGPGSLMIFSGRLAQRVVWPQKRNGVWLVAHLVRDEGVARSNPATPTRFLVAPITYAASYAERNSRVIISRPRFTRIRSLDRSRGR
jgi:hypothetical protein